MKLILNEKSSLDSVLKKVAQAAVKLGFDQAESDAAKAAVVNFHTLLTSSQSEHINSEFEKAIKGANGKQLRIKAISSSQQGFISRLLSV